MPALDQPIDVMFGKSAAALILETDRRIMLELDGARRAITKEPLGTPQVMRYLKEVMPEAMYQQLSAGEGRVAFGYLAGEHPVDIETDRTGNTVAVVITPAKPRQSSPAISMPAEILRTESAPESRIATAPATADTHLSQGEEAVQELLRQLVYSDSSDLHLRVSLPPYLRTHGELHPLDGAEPLGREQIEVMVQAIMPDRTKAEFAETSDTDFAYEMVDLARFRVNAFRDRMGAAAVFRVIPSEILTVEYLGLSDEVQQLCNLSKGLILVTGPTGSGKSSTLAAMIDQINRTRTDHIVTIEDPIEFVHLNKKCIVTQRQVGNHTQSFKRALRAALREDPDIILIGEMRDLETVAIAIETAETGHLVFGTLHTATAVSTVDRIIDQFPADRQDQIRIMLSESLKAVIAQVLVKKTGGGRVAAYEILLSLPAVSNLIREGKTHQLLSIIQTNKKMGMTTLNDSLVDLVIQKLVEPEEAYLKAVDKDGFESLLRAKGFHSITQH